jgi:mannosyl-oligosaccharide alpha-1,2-mannosidase
MVTTHTPFHMTAWRLYRNRLSMTCEFGSSRLGPGSHADDRNSAGWGASAIDALSTATVMGDKKVVNQILDYVPTIDFTKANYSGSVSLFETTIRYLGGLVSGMGSISATPC